VQRWKNGAVYFGQWTNNREHGKGTYYFPVQQDPDSADHPAKLFTYALFVGDFQNGCPVQGVLLEGKNVLQMTSDDITLATKIDPILGKNVPFGPCCAFRVLFDGRSAFWQRPTPLEKIGEFEAKIKICQFETRGLKRTFLQAGKIEDVWYRMQLEPGSKTTSKEKCPIALPVESKEGEEGNDTAVAVGQTAGDALRRFQTEKLYKTFRFRGTCVCNKAGNFPCPTKGTLYDEDKEFNVEYDGKSSLFDWPNPVRISGKYKYDLPSYPPGESLCL
jgi:hypothetical protein